MAGGLGLQLPQSESQGMSSRGSYTPTTEEDLDMIQVKSRKLCDAAQFNNYVEYLVVSNNNPCYHIYSKKIYF